jgi:hypothetical protein
MPGGTCDGDNWLGDIITTGGGTTAGVGMSGCEGSVGLCCVTGEAGGGGAAGRAPNGDVTSMCTGGAAVDGVGIGAYRGATGAAGWSWAQAGALGAIIAITAIRGRTDMAYR